MDIMDQLHKALENLSAAPSGASGNARKGSLDEGLDRAA